MPFNGSGTYNLPDAQLVTGGTVDATEHNAFRNDVANALTDCVTRDGQSPATANIPMGGFKHTNLAAGSANGDSIRYQQVFDGAGGTTVPYMPSGTGAVATTVQTKLRETVSVKDFGAVGDGVTNDRSAITAAFAASKNMHFPAGVYNCGDVTGGGGIFGTIDGGGGPVTITTDGVVEFRCNTTTQTLPAFFDIVNASGVTIGDVRFFDSGYNGDLDWKGACGVRITVSTGFPVSDVMINSIKAENMVMPFEVTGNTTTRATGINIGMIYCKNCYYGPLFQNNGDAVRIGMVYAESCKRSLYAYGVDDLRASIYSKSNQAASADCLIASYDTGYDTTNIDIKYTCRTPNNASTCVLMAIFGESARKISNVKLDLDVVSTTGSNLVSMRSYDSSGVQNTGVTTNIWTGIDVRFVGSTTGATHVIMYAQPSTKGTIVLDKNLLSSKLSGIFPYFSFKDYPAFTFTPTIAGTITAGTGTYTTQSGHATVINGRLFFDINLTWTAHTGTGNIVIQGLPLRESASGLITSITTLYNNMTVGAGLSVCAIVSQNDNQIYPVRLDPAAGTQALLPMDTAATLWVSGNIEI